MKGFKKYQMLNMFFAYNEKTNNYFLVRHYSYGTLSTILINIWN